MFEKAKLSGVDISIDYCGRRLQSPYILSSGPLTYGAAGMIRGHQAGCGAVVTKTLRLEAAENPVHHIGTIGRNSLINCEKWADLECEAWYNKEIPEAIQAGCTVICSVGHRLDEAREIVENAEKAGAHMIELVSYTEDTMIPMLDFTKAHVSIPVICKLSANWPDAVGVAKTCLEHGADGICAVDSIGPALKIDIKTARPQMMGDGGYGWMTGEAMRAISMRINADIARAHPDFKNLYSSGGCMTADDAIEFMMAGARGIGICSAPMLKGVPYIEKMCYALSQRVAGLGYASLDEVVGVALKHMGQKEQMGVLDFSFQAHKKDGSKLCTSCKLCETVCSYQARALTFPEMSVDMTLCRSCGLCVDVCPTGALTSTVNSHCHASQREEQASKDLGV